MNLETRKFKLIFEQIPYLFGTHDNLIAISGIWY